MHEENVLIQYYQHLFLYLWSENPVVVRWKKTTMVEESKESFPKNIKTFSSDSEWNLRATDATLV